MASNGPGAISIYRTYRVRTRETWWSARRSGLTAKIDRALEDTEKYAYEVGEVLCPTDKIPLAERPRTLLWGLVAYAIICVIAGAAMSGQVPFYGKLPWFE